MSIRKIPKTIHFYHLRVQNTNDQSKTYTLQHYFEKYLEGVKNIKIHERPNGTFEYDGIIRSESIKEILNIKYYIDGDLIYIQLGRPQETYDVTRGNANTGEQKKLGLEDDEYLFKNSFFVIDNKKNAMCCLFSKSAPTVKHLLYYFSFVTILTEDGAKEDLYLDYAPVLNKFALESKNFKKISEFETSLFANPTTKPWTMSERFGSKNIKAKKVTLKFKIDDQSEENINNLMSYIKELYALVYPDDSFIDDPRKDNVSDMKIRGILANSDQYTTTHDIIDQYFNTIVKIEIDDGFSELDSDKLFGQLSKTYMKVKNNIPNFLIT